MKQLPTVLFFLFTFIVNAQLSIRNDNYLFVTDELLFINDDVNLGETDSKIYLRNDAQLIQGTGTTGNSGVGQLSVYQNGTTHNFAYNYWCSPVGNNSAVLGNEGFTTNLLDDATGLLTSTDALFTSSHDGSSSPLTISSYWIYTFENATQYSEWFYRGSTGSIAPGLGFTMKGTNGSGNNQLYDFRGKPNNGTISNSVTTAEWTLVGNPYPSAIDALDYIHDTDNAAAITGTLYYWEHDLSVMSHYVSDYVGGYATYTINASGTLETFVPATFDTYNSDGSLNTTGSSSTSGKQARRYIPIGQGFMIEGSVGTTGTVYTKNSHREFYKQSDSNSEFFRMSNSDNVAPIESDTTVENTTTNDDSLYPFGEIPQEYMRFRLNVDLNDVYTRQLVQTFHDTEATIGFDYGLESKSPSDVTNDAYWFSENESYIAQALPFNINMSIPLHIKLNDNATIRIRIFDIQHFDTNQPIFVHDLETGIYTDLRTLPFEVTLPQGEYNDRFEIVFIESTLNVEDVTLSNIYVTQDDSEKNIFIHNPLNYKLKEVTIYDVSGRKIVTKKQLKTKPLHKLNTQSFSTGVYLLHIVTSNHGEITKKLIIK